MSLLNRNPRQLGGLAGMIAPVLFVGIFLLEGWLRPDYDPRADFVSELAIGPRGWIQILNFVVTGTLLLVWARGMATEFSSGKMARGTRILLTITGICLLLSGPFITDPMPTPPGEMTVTGTIHNLLGALFFSLTTLTCFLFLRRFREDSHWRWLTWWTLAAAVIMTACVVLMSVAPTEPPAPPNEFNAWSGFIQRVFLITYMAWVFIIANNLYRLSNIERIAAST